MRVIVNTYPVAFQCPGGGEIQLLKSIDALEKLGIEVIKFDPWTTKLTNADVVHHFSVQGGSMHFCGYTHTQGIPLVISPIIWLGDNPEIYPVGEIAHLLQISDIICPNSNAEAQQLGSYFNIPEDKFVITHNGIDEIFTQKVDGQLFRDTYTINTPFVLCVANIEPRKNQLNLIKAIKELNKKLILIGNIRDNDYYDQCMAIANDHVEYVGYIDHHDPLLRSAYDACDVFALPSTLETPGLAALEAAASNAIIVITEIGATKEYFTDNAFYVSPESHQSIKEGLLKAFDTNNLTTENSFFKKYSWDQTALQLLTAYPKAIQLHKNTVSIQLILP